MNTREITTLWADWLRHAERLFLLLHEQTVAVTLRDVPRVERLTPLILQGMEALRAIDSLAVNALRALAERLGVEAGLRAIVAALPKEEGQPLQATANKIVVLEGKIGHVVAKNRKLLEAEMTFVDGTLTLIAREGGPKPRRSPYTRRNPPEAILLSEAA